MYHPRHLSKSADLATKRTAHWQLAALYKKSYSDTSFFESKGLTPNPPFSSRAGAVSVGENNSLFTFQKECSSPDFQSLLFPSCSLILNGKRKYSTDWWGESNIHQAKEAPDRISQFGETNQG